MAKQKLKASFIITTIGVITALGVLIYLLWPHLALFKDPDQARAFIEEAGPWAPLVFILLQIAQVFFAPIPGQATGFLGGYLFGTFLGTLYTMIGALIGFTLIFILARKLGRPFVERFVSEKVLNKFDYLADTKGIFVLFLIFLLPAFPDDMICFIAGLTKIRIRTLIIISLLGRLPGYLVLSFTGSGLAEDKTTLTIIIFGIMMLISGIAYWQRHRLEHLAKALHQKFKHKK